MKSSATHLRSTRKKDRLRFPEVPGIDEVAFEFESLDFLATDRKFNAYLADFREIATDKIRLHQHSGVEFIYVLKGRLALKVGSERGVFRCRRFAVL